MAWLYLFCLQPESFGDGGHLQHFDTRGGLWQLARGSPVSCRLVTALYRRTRVKL